MKLLYTTLFLSILALSACKKDADKPAPDPVLPQSDASVSRKFTYPATNTADSASFMLSWDSIKISGSTNTGKQLVLAIDVSYPKGNDYIQFTIEQAKLKPGYVGEYAIVSAPVGGLQGDAQVAYRYKRDVYSYVEFYPGNADGVLMITAYDPQQQLLAGTYSFHINSFHDPKVGTNWVETKIDVKGSFGNLQVK
jgi:hypothetical protein